MVKKRKAADALVEGDAPREAKRVRNRASPSAVVKLYEHLSDNQKSAVQTMELESMLEIKCGTLHNPVINWLAGLYDKESREFVIPGRGKIPVNEASVYHTLGLRLGSEPVPYHADYEIQAALGPVLFPEDGITPLTTRVFQIMKDMKEYDDGFKQIFVMYIVSTILSPTTRNHVSNRCYPIMVAKVSNAHKLQWCKFVADQLHAELCKGNFKFDKGCLFHLQLLYVDSLDISRLGIVLSRGRLAVTIWSKENVATVLKDDLQNDGKAYGKLELKPQFGQSIRIPNPFLCAYAL